MIHECTCPLRTPGAQPSLHRPPPAVPPARVKRYVQSNSIRSAVVSMSLGGPRSAALNDAAADLTSAGITVVVAAGARLAALAAACSGARLPAGRVPRGLMCWANPRPRATPCRLLQLGRPGWGVRTDYSAQHAPLSALSFRARLLAGPVLDVPAVKPLRPPARPCMPGNNRGADACTQSPASAPSSITVGATTRDVRKSAHRGCSQRGSLPRSQRRSCVLFCQLQAWHPAPQPPQGLHPLLSPPYRPAGHNRQLQQHRILPQPLCTRLWHRVCILRKRLWGTLRLPALGCATGTMRERGGRSLVCTEPVCPCGQLHTPRLPAVQRWPRLASLPPPTHLPTTGGDHERHQHGDAGRRGRGRHVPAGEAP